MKKPPSKKQSSTSRKRTPTSGPAPDRLMMEKMMVDMTRLLQSREFSSVDEMNAFLSGAVQADLKPPAATTPLERAQDLMYEAWTASGKRRTTLAHKALEISPDCVDAYVLLAEEAASPAQAKTLYEQGVAAGERALGLEFFQENVGHFWGIVETRPYMRAREGLAHVLWLLGEQDRAVENFEEMLRLNPGDNQGVRYGLARFLLEKGDNERLGNLLDRYPEEGSAEWAYVRALQSFRVFGESDTSNQALTIAFETNAMVALYMLGIRELPDSPPEYYSPGDENEAALYVGYSAPFWVETPGALDWFADHLQRTLKAFENQQAATSRARSPRQRANKPATSVGTIYQLKVTLRRSKPPIWRRILVPADTKLSRLHNILQVAMGWTNSHLHMFRVGKTHFGVPSADLDWMEVFDERKATLAEVLPRAKSKMMYEYDFGDCWEHDVLVEKILDADPDAAYPACLAGKRACPPEDCGGVWGYEGFLEAIADPRHPEHESSLEWIGGAFDPEAFDPVWVSKRLAARRR